MAYQMYMTIKGSKQGIFSGNPQHKDGSKIEIFGFEYGGLSSRDAATGQASGRRVHKPITILKEIDASSPKLLMALTTNETLSSVLIEFVKQSAVYQSIQLTDGILQSIKPAHGPGGRLCEELIIAFEYTSSNFSAHQSLSHAALLAHA